jgi:hypothetical protein
MTRAIVGSTLLIGTVLLASPSAGQGRSAPDPTPPEIARRGGHLVRSAGNETQPPFDSVQFLDCIRLDANDIDLLRQLPRLTHLNLRLSRITPDMLRAVSGLKRLTYLNLSNTRVTDADLPVLAGMPNLEHLVLNHTRVTGAGLTVFGPPERARPIFVELAGSDVRTDALGVLSSLPLIALNLSDTDAADDWLSALPTTLTSLRLAHTHVTDVGLEIIARRFPELTFLDLSGNRLTEDGVRSLRRLGRLEELHVDDVKDSATCEDGRPKLLSDATLAGLKTLSHLKNLHIGYSAVSDDGVTAFLSDNDHIIELKLTGTPTTGRFGKPKTTLQRLDISGTPVNEEGLRTVAQIRTLTDLWLLNTNLGDAALVKALGDASVSPQLTIYPGDLVTPIGILSLGGARGRVPGPALVPNVRKGL